MKKSLIIGACTGYNYNQLKPWAESIGRTGFTGDKVMVIGEASEATKQALIDEGFLLVPMLQVNAPIHVARFLTIYHYLRDTWNDYEYVVTTDVKDVYFQTNPIKWLIMGGNAIGDLVVGSESMRYRDEPWGNNNLLQAYGPYIHNLFKDNIIYNVGTIGGVAENVKDLMFNIYSNAVNRPIPIVDQAVFNVLIQTQPYKDNIFFAEQSDGWACQAGTTADPSKIEAFRPFLTEGEPIFENGIVKTSKGQPFCIVHQYDRVPVWAENVRKMYNQEDSSKYFTYKTA